MKARRKNIFLVTGFVLMVIISYKFSISKTFGLKNEIEGLEQQKTELAQLSGLASTLKKREQYADSLLREHRQLNGSVQSNLLDLLNANSQELGYSVSDFQEPHRYEDGGLTINTFQFTLRGSFSGIQSVLFEIEQKYNFGEIRNVHFEKKKDFRARKEYLECSVVIENQFAAE